MKKIFMVALVALFAIGLVFKPTASHAVEAKLGIEMMGDWWQPAFLKFEQEKAGKLFAKNFKNDSEGSFMLGPMFWVNVSGNWNLGGKVLFGISRNEFTYSTAAVDVNLLRYFLPGMLRPGLALGAVPLGFYDVGKSECRRYDTDLYAEYGFHKYFNLVIGARFNYYDGEGDSVRMISFWPNIDAKDEKYSAWYLGPSLGVTFHYEFVKGLTFSLGLAALFQFGEYDNEKKYFLTVLNGIPFNYKAGYFCIGLDTNIKLAYLIEAAHLEIFVGGRYIMLPHIAAGDESSGWDISYKNGWIDGEIDHWGGINFGVAYKF